MYYHGIILGIAGLVFIRDQDPTDFLNTLSNAFMCDISQNINLSKILEQDAGKITRI